MSTWQTDKFWDKKMQTNFPISFGPLNYTIACQSFSLIQIQLNCSPKSWINLGCTKCSSLSTNVYRLICGFRCAQKHKSDNFSNFLYCHRWICAIVQINSLHSVSLFGKRQAFCFHTIYYSTVLNAKMLHQTTFDCVLMHGTMCC